MKKWLFISCILLLIIVGIFFSFNAYIYQQKQGNSMDTTTNINTEATKESFSVTPISHATMVLTLNDQVIYNDPVGGAEAFTGQPAAQIILISDIHGDHFNEETLRAVSKPETVIVIPQAVFEMLPQNLSGKVVVLHNGEKTTQNGIEIEALPMYNIPESDTAPHTKGRGNGYVLSAAGKRIYIAGDTNATPEMEVLTNIDVAFVPMNLPYTMDIQEAADGVLAFKPKVVHPYHYRGQEGLSDVKKFKELVETKDKNISVGLLNFYPQK